MKKKNKPDLTTRNARAYNKRLKALEDIVKELSEVIGHKKGDWYDLELKQEVYKQHEKITELAYEIVSLTEEYKDSNHQLKKIMNYFQQYFIKRKVKK